MGIESISISFSPSLTGSGAYRPGETLHGVMTLTIGGRDPHSLSSLLVKVRGLARTRWKTSSGSGKNRHTKTHTEDLWLLREDIFFIRGPTVEALYPGTYQYPFSYTLRRSLPPSFSAQFGQISYMCKARAISSDFFSFNGKEDFTFTVLPLLDLNAEPQLAEPLVVEREAEQSLFGHAIGQFRMTMSRQGFIGGQPIDITIDGPDRLFQKMAKASGVVKLKQRTVCTAHGRTRETKTDVSAVTVAGVPQRPSGWRRLQLTVPRHQAITISATTCRIITVTYYIKVSSRHINLHLPLTIGTEPFAAGPAWQPSPRPSPAHPATVTSAQRYDFAPSAPSAPSAPACQAPDYDPPPTYDEVMRAGDGGGDGGFTKLADL
ncbi:arrestin domain-containing protein 17-like [Pollicipes pollicipes]|uniref:arrestin domain-containing protein 17-like n=1 Tax=Pollicipes pollicipes TaxID=41117 RepID=UPI0018851614|nr:arrestin domain-containing protein 17-like [Pollicipes pollicipes]